MFHIRHTILLQLIFICVHGLTFDGPCPQLPEDPGKWTETCKDLQYHPNENIYIVFAQLSVPGWVSLFNSQWDLDCLSYKVDCRRSKASLVALTQQCNGYKILKDIEKIPTEKPTDEETPFNVVTFKPPESKPLDYYGPGRCTVVDAARSCLPVVYDLKRIPGKEQLQNYGMVYSHMCVGMVANFTYYTSRRDNYLTIYGCMDLPESNQHEEGAWIMLQREEIIKTKDSYFATLLDTILEELAGISATRSNFEMVDFRNLINCTCDACTITSECPARASEEEEDFNDYKSFSIANYYDYEYDGEGDNRTTIGEITDSTTLSEEKQAPTTTANERFTTDQGSTVTEEPTNNDMITTAPPTSAQVIETTTVMSNVETVVEVSTVYNVAVETTEAENDFETTQAIEMTVVEDEEIISVAEENTPKLTTITDKIITTLVPITEPLTTTLLDITTPV